LQDKRPYKAYDSALMAFSFVFINSFSEIAFLTKNSNVKTDSAA
jgi:hypothetical protein